MSLAHLLWSSTGSADRPMILVLRLSNSDFSLAMAPSSVVQTGVKSLGCENRIAHLSPIHLWKSIGPSGVLRLEIGCFVADPQCHGILLAVSKKFSAARTLPATGTLQYSRRNL